MLFSLYSVEMEDLFPLEPTWMLAVAASVLALVMLRRLIKPLHFQNTAFITVVLMLGQAFIEWLVVVRICKTDLPDPRWRYYAGAALLWMAISLTARRFAKLIARPWRKERVHWLWVIFLSGLGAGAFQFFWPLLEPEFSMRRKLLAMAGTRAGCTMVVLAILSPWFVRKRARKGKDFSELPDDPDDDADDDAEEQASDDGEVKAAPPAVVMNVSGQTSEPSPPAAPQA